MKTSIFILTVSIRMLEAGAGAQNDSITVSISDPQLGASFRSHEQFAIQANISDLDGFITRAEFLADGAPVGQVTAAPYILFTDGSHFTAGTHTLTVRATDNRGNVATSAAVSIAFQSYAPTLHAVYLIPTNAVFHQAYFNAIQSALTNLQSFYAAQLSNGRTFRLNNPVVEVYVTPHIASWYTNNPGGYFNNVLNDGSLLTGATYPDADATWAYYVDANSAGQPTGGILGAAVLHQGDLMGLIGQSSQSTNRWIGGSGHEIGHAFGLVHPPGCENPMPGVTCPTSALMWLGYITYPNTFLLPADKQILTNSAFFYRPSTSPLIYNLTSVSNVLSFDASTEIGWPYHVLSSTNLVDWSEAFKFIAMSTNIHVNLTNGAPAAYYHLKFP